MLRPQRESNDLLLRNLNSTYKLFIPCYIRLPGNVHTKEFKRVHTQKRLVICSAQRFTSAVSEGLFPPSNLFYTCIHIAQRITSHPRKPLGASAEERARKMTITFSLVCCNLLSFLPYYKYIYTISILQARKPRETKKACVRDSRTT